MIKKLTLICEICLAIISIYWGVFLRFTNMELSETELFVEYWYLLIPFMLLIIAFLVLINLEEKKRRNNL